MTSSVIIKRSLCFNFLISNNVGMRIIMMVIASKRTIKKKKGRARQGNPISVSLWPARVTEQDYDSSKTNKNPNNSEAEINLEVRRQEAEGTSSSPWTR